MDAKFCKCCERTLPETAFGKLKSRPDGLQFYCKECGSEKRKAARAKNPEKYKKYNAQWKRDNRERVAGYTRDYRARNPKKQKASLRKYDLMRHYGITVEEFDRMVLDQIGRCACCDDELRKPCVDHCHDSEHVRALLCSACNFAIGHAQESVDRLQAMIRYLEKHALRSTDR